MDILMTNNGLFKNTLKLPLNKLYLTIKNVKLQENYNSLVKCDEKFPAIHAGFIDKQTFPLYEVYFWNVETNENNNEAFLRSCMKYVDSLDFLLQLNYHQFWCYITKNPNTINMLNSFLCNFSPCVDLNLMDKECVQVVAKITNKFGMIISRLFTYTHSDVEFMAPIVVLHLLEDCHLLTFDGVVNICVLYHKTCPAMVNDIANAYFHETRIDEWLPKVVAFSEIVYMVLECTKSAICGDADETMLESLGLCSKPQYINLCWYMDVISLVVETLSAFQALLEHCPPLRKIGVLKNIATYHLAKFYELVFPALYKLLRSDSGVDDRQQAVRRIFQQIHAARKLCIEAFSVFTNHYINCMASGSQEEQASLVEQYLKMITGVLEEEQFLFDYNTYHNVENDFVSIRVYYPELDPTQTDYIRRCLNTLPKLHEITHKKQLVERERRRADEAAKDQPVASMSSAMETAPEELTAEQRVQIIANVFPDFPPECIEECLAFCHYDHNVVIQLIMENNLPPHIVDMQRTGVVIPPEPAPVPPIHAFRGKKPRAVDATLMLDDKDQQLKELTLKAVDMRQCMYDDDYDDRVENEQICASFVRDSSESSSDEQEEEVERGRGDRRDAGVRSDQAGVGRSNGNQNSFRAFCEDPAKLREQREMAKSSFRGRGGGARGGRDVVGKPRGQGQDKQVTQNRDKKTANKASKGNHNRKSGAQWKASRGMF